MTLIPFLPIIRETSKPAPLRGYLILMKIPKFLSNLFTNPSPRAKVRWAILGIIALSVFAAAVDYPQGVNQLAGWINNKLEVAKVETRVGSLTEEPYKLGLDLQGGALLVYQANFDGRNVDSVDLPEAMARLRDRIERRVNSLGVSEPVIQVAGSDRLVVELAGVDINEAIDQIGETPLLEFREQNNVPPRELTEEEKAELEEFNAGQQEKASGVLVRLKSGQESFEDLAREFSEDPTAENGGDFGSVTPATNPEFVTAARDTLIGKLVPELVELDDAIYILRVDDRKEDDVEMLLSHILICYTGASNCGEERTREEALALATQVKAELTTDNFAQKATEFSSDLSNKEDGGDLNWVAPARTVEPFENAAKELEVGQITDPVETDFGYHLIYKRDQRPFGETFLHVIKFEKKVAADFLPTPEPYINTGLTGGNVSDAALVFDQNTNAPQISLQFDEEGTRLFSEITQRHIGEPIAIYLDGEPISVPVVQAHITTGEAVITGQFSLTDARDLARQLKDGALPVPIDLIQEQNIGASLGAESLQKSLQAAIVGLILVAGFMLLYYRLLGLLAILALVVYGLVTLMVFRFIGVTLTLSGIAGFVLSLGMAVDANVLIFERFREERKQGKALQEATEAAFDRAWPSIRDGNFSTLITCLILGWQGTSVVQGFAVTLAIGVVVSMFSAIIVTKSLMRLIIAWPINKIKVLFASGLSIKG